MACFIPRSTGEIGDLLGRKLRAFDCDLNCDLIVTEVFGHSLFVPHVRSAHRQAQDANRNRNGNRSTFGALQSPATNRLRRLRASPKTPIELREHRPYRSWLRTPRFSWASKSTPQPCYGPDADRGGTALPFALRIDFVKAEFPHHLAAGSRFRLQTSVLISCTRNQRVSFRQSPHEWRFESITSAPKPSVQFRGAEPPEIANSVRRNLSFAGHARESLRVNVQESRRFFGGQHWLERYGLMMTHNQQVVC